MIDEDLGNDNKYATETNRIFTIVYTQKNPSSN